MSNFKIGTTTPLRHYVVEQSSYSFFVTGGLEKNFNDQNSSLTQSSSISQTSLRFFSLKSFRASISSYSRRIPLLTSTSILLNKRFWAILSVLRSSKRLVQEYGFPLECLHAVHKLKKKPLRCLKQWLSFSMVTQFHYSQFD